ncbi:DUF2461 domain-containing protein [Robiginitalea aurantiaca]|uniref:DUF2461 domain-containing protein n=1 Tax=Robiginitalea aurantiaca TaxID=3056915 RepID=A0ABT7WFS6_9FLAO|nr:DUF2461 domain-containing protein [Robiginitalea aurantiaca]MDM9631773.1 DUF2461 domain-containing protein [Robiginitalea aurantiaca]
MQTPLISNEILGFLKGLGKNNNREWFEANRKAYEAARSSMLQFSEAQKMALQSHDEIEKMKLFRIHRDLRFSKDKTPYKPHFAVSFSRSGAERRGGYYLRIRPGASFIACGFWDPNKEDLLRIRKELELDAEPFKRVIDNPEFQSVWGDLQGDAVKTAPKGFEREHPNIELIRKKQFIFTRNFTDKEVKASVFPEIISSSYREIRPFFDLMSEILTTDLNGESILD